MQWTIGSVETCIVLSIYSKLLGTYRKENTMSNRNEVFTILAQARV